MHSQSMSVAAYKQQRKFAQTFRTNRPQLCFAVCARTDGLPSAHAVGCPDELADCMTALLVVQMGLLTVRQPCWLFR